MGIAGCGIGRLVEVNQPRQCIVTVWVIDWEAIPDVVMLEGGTGVS